MNGILGREAPSVVSVGTKKTTMNNESQVAPVQNSQHLTNGVHEAATNGDLVPFSSSSPLSLADLPLEIRQQFHGAFMPLSGVIKRSAQLCWNDLSDMADELAHLSTQHSDSLTNGYLANGGGADGQSKFNLDKKDRLLNFANDQRAKFIKLLVLLQWSKDAEDVAKALHISCWLHQQRQTFFSASFAIVQMKRRLTSLQLPNPDLRTAARTLASGTVSELPRLGYIPEKPLTNRQILRTLRSLNRILCSRLTLTNDLPIEFHRFHIHDGRITFMVPDEFELDLTVMNADETSRYHFLDFRFAFSPSSSLPEGSLHSDISVKINELLGNVGLQGCFDFLHEMVLSYKLSLLHKQALDLLQGQYANNLRVELIRRTLVVQYWTSRSTAKSWIEIGVKSRRRDSYPSLTSRTKSSLHLKWMRELKEVEGVSIAINPGVLDLESVLREILALHTSTTLDLIYEKLISVSAYADGELELEQTYSSPDPSDCRLVLQLTKAKRTTITIESATGALILSPTTALSSRLEQEMRQSKNIADDVVPKLSHFRCTVAEQELVNAAESVGWIVIRTFKVSNAEMKALFTEPISKVVFLRQAHWEAEYLLAATHGIHGDYWWLIRRSGDLNDSALWTAQRLDSQPMHAETTVSCSYLARLANYVSGMITLQTNAASLVSMSLQFVLRKMPRFEKKYQLPKISLDFQPAKLRPVLSIQPTPADFGIGVGVLHPSSKELYPDHSWIRRTIAIKYHDRERNFEKASVVARGRSSASRRVLQQLADSAMDPLIQINPIKKQFAIRLPSSVGTPVIEQLLRKLLQLENMLACLSVINKYPSTRVMSLSASFLSVQYLDSPENSLGIVVHFATSSEPAHLELWPRKSNPHMLIATQLTEVLTDPRRSLPTNLRLLIPLLTYTHPVLSFFQEIQIPAKTDPNALETTATEHRPRLHIMPRHATMYGIHYFAPTSMAPTMPADAEGSRRMLARLEILPSERNKQSYWILRPALEEFETYTRPSFSMQDLNEKLKEEIFSSTDEEKGWLALDQGAVCPVDKPQRLLQKLDELMMSWLRGSPLSKENAAVGDGTVPSGQPGPPGPPVSEGTGKQQLPARTQLRGGVQQRPQANSATQAGQQRPQANSANQAKAKKNQVIELD